MGRRPFVHVLHGALFRNSQVATKLFIIVTYNYNWGGGGGLTDLTLTLHTEPAPAVRAAVKTVLSCQSFALSPEQCISVVRVDLPRRKEAIKVFIREVNSNKYIINTVLPSSYT